MGVTGQLWTLNANPFIPSAPAVSWYMNVSQTYALATNTRVINFTSPNVVSNPNSFQNLFTIDTVTRPGLVTYNGTRTRSIIVMAQFTVTWPNVNAVVTHFFGKNPANAPTNITISTTQSRQQKQVTANTQNVTDGFMLVDTFSMATGDTIQICGGDATAGTITYVYVTFMIFCPWYN